MLALDRQEAQATVDRFAAEMSPVELYDRVIIPALALAEEDRHRGALDEIHENFVVQIVAEFIEKLASFPDNAIAAGAPDSVQVDYGGRATRMICLPAADKADELAGAMLSHALQTVNIPGVCLPFDPSNIDTLQDLSLEAGDMVCISAFPPFALLSARTGERRRSATTWIVFARRSTWKW